MTAGMDFQGLSNVARFLRGRLLLGRLAVLNGLIREDELRACLREQRERPDKPPLAKIMVECGMLSEGQVAELLEQQKHLDELDATGRVIPAVPGADRMVGRYVLLDEVGHGAASVVYKAWDTQLQRNVALKEIRRGSSFPRDRFLAEARAAAKLRHPNLIEAYEVFEDVGLHYLAMTFIDGQPLDRARLPIPAVAALMAEVCDAVQYMHLEGILHRDIKPQNILVDAQGKGHLGDFGLAKDMNRRTLTVEGQFLGTPVYMAPEQVSGNPKYIGPATDVYGLGAALYHAVTGRPPFEAGTDLEALFMRLGCDRPPDPSSINPDVPAALAKIIGHAMEKLPTDRYVNAKEMGEDLRRFLQDRKVEARPVPASTRAARWVWKNFLLAAAVGAAVLGLSTAVLLAMGQGAAHGKGAAYYEAYQRGVESWARALGTARGARVDEAGLAAAAGEALREFGRAAEAEPANPAPWLMKGRCLILLRRGAEAEAALTEAVSRDPAFGPALLERGKLAGAAYLQRRPPPSLRLSGQRAVAGPGEPEDEAARRLRERSRADLDRARKAKGLDPAELKYLEGAIAFGEGRYEVAIPSLEGYVRANAWDAAAMTLLGAALSLTRDWARAEKVLGKALDLEPRAHRFRMRGDVRFCAGRPAEAAEDYAQALRLEPDDPALLCNRGLVRQALGDSAGAMADFDRAIARQPSFARAYNNRGTARVEKLDLAAALADFQKAVELSPFYAEAYNNLGNVLLLQQKVDEAIEEYGMALECDPGFVGAYANRGMARRLKGDSAGAAADFRKALSLDPGNPDVLYDLAGVCRMTGDMARAKASLQKALEYALPGWPRRKEAERLLREWSRP
jgi:serine/threonine-protein kinase